VLACRALMIRRAMGYLPARAHHPSWHSYYPVYKCFAGIDAIRIKLSRSRKLAAGSQIDVGTDSPNRLATIIVQESMHKSLRRPFFETGV